MNPVSNQNQSVILPGATVGILGGGQLGRMIALEGRKMGYRFVTLDPTPDSPCGQVSDTQIVASFTDVAAAQRLAEQCDVITYEFENVDAEVARILEAHSNVPQGSRLLRTTQHRVREKSALQAHGIPVTPFLPAASLDELLRACRELGFPCVLKTSTGGYDGKGQWLLHNLEEAQLAWEEFSSKWTGPEHSDLSQRSPSAADESIHTGGKDAPGNSLDAPLVVEKFISFTKELSVVVARSVRGEVKSFPVAENIHVHHILHQSIVPARTTLEIELEARSIAQRIATQLNVVGLIAVEMFLTPDGQIFVNELAPRPHNSGHFTYDVCETSQFEQHLRAICNLPLGSAKLLTPVVMVNVLGQHVQPLLQEVPNLPDNVKIHLYGKKDAKPGRKMGHVCILAEDVEQALTQADSLGIWEMEN